MDSDECDRDNSSANVTSRTVLGSRINVMTPNSSPYFLDSALPSDCDLTYDHHSSEEELEVINGKGSCDTTKRVGRSPFGSRCRSVSSVLPEKRKWSDAMDAESQGESLISCNPSRVRISTRRHTSSNENVCLGEEPSITSHKFVSSCSSGASSDDETAPNGAFAPIAPSTPVNFCKSPPLNAHKPPTLRSLSPPLKMLNCDTASEEQQRSQNVSSPRYKRHRLTPTIQRTQHAHNIQRPCLDFEKMQQNGYLRNLKRSTA
ncbi:hypothetical protein PGB90_006011 [Kerria lacca]